MPCFHFSTLLLARFCWPRWLPSCLRRAVFSVFSLAFSNCCSRMPIVPRQVLPWENCQILWWECQFRTWGCQGLAWGFSAEFLRHDRSLKGCSTFTVGRAHGVFAMCPSFLTPFGAPVLVIPPLVALQQSQLLFTQLSPLLACLCLGVSLLDECRDAWHRSLHVLGGDLVSLSLAGFDPGGSAQVQGGSG